MKFPLNALAIAGSPAVGTLVIRFHSKSHWSCTFFFPLHVCVRVWIGRLCVLAHVAVSIGYFCDFVCRHVRGLCARLCASICQHFCACRNTSVQGLTDLCAQAGLSVCWLIYPCVRLQRASRRDVALSLSLSLSFFFFFKEPVEEPSTDSLRGRLSHSHSQSSVRC